MTSAQFKAACAAVGLDTQGKAAAFLGVSIRTANGYANGGAIPVAVAKLLRVMVRLGLRPAEVR